MVVELKKTKITKSIVDQSLFGRDSLFYNWENNYDLLEWCVIKANKKLLRYNLLYHKNDKQIIKLPYIVYENHIELYKETVQRGSDKEGWIFTMVYKLKLRWADFGNSRNILEQTEETDEKMQEFFQKVKDFKYLVEQKGQIYL
jgi:hypothetical protein